MGTRTLSARITGFAGVLFDLDGVITPTAEVHMLAWASTFREVFEEHGIARPYTEADYFAYVDGRPRYEGVAAVLASRGLKLPWGSPSDPPTADTVSGIGNRKNGVFARILDEDGVTPYPGSVEFLDAAEAAGLRVAVVSSSRNARPVLTAARLIDRFPVIVDGILAAEASLAGKPAGDTYAYGAGLLGLEPSACIVVEDALSGVVAGVAAGAGLVIGVDRGAGRDALVDAGAGLVVEDLAELVEG